MRRHKLKKRNSTGKHPCDVCKNITFLHEHHINGREIPNPNHISNLCSICPTCHDLVHRGKIIIEGYVYTSNGMELISRKCDQESLTNNDSKPPIFGKINT